MKIPFVKPPLLGGEWEYMQEALSKMSHAGGGEFTKKCQSFLEKEFGFGKVLLTTSGTDALEMAAYLVDGKAGDEFILPSYTFSSTATAFVARGMKPVYVDVREDTLNIDEKLIEGAITERTKAIVPIAYAGIPAEMQAITKIADKYKIQVVEDAAQSVGSTQGGKYSGGLSPLATFSFHATKAYSCGEGGALIMNDDCYNKRSDFLWEKGTDRCQVIQGLKNKYHWVDYGSSFLPSDILAAMLLYQLEHWQETLQIRGKLFTMYQEVVKEFEPYGISGTVVPEGTESNFHAFWILFPSESKRNLFLEKSKINDFIPYIGYIPLHTSPMGLVLGGGDYKLPVTDSIGTRVSRLPFYLMSDDEIDFLQGRLRKSLSLTLK